VLVILISSKICVNCAYFVSKLFLGVYLYLQGEDTLKNHYRDIPKILKPLIEKKKKGEFAIVKQN